MDQIGSRQTSRLLFAILLSGMVTGVAWAQAPTPPAATPTPAAGSTPVASQSAVPMLESPVSADKVVLKVGDLQFTKANIDFLIENLPPQMQHDIATKGKRPLGEQYALIVILSQQAHLHQLDQTPEFVQKLALQKQQLEAQEEINRIAPEQVQQYYTTHAADYDQITVRQFIVRKKAADPKADPAHPAGSPGTGLAPEEAKARVEAIRKEVVAGTDLKKVMDDFKAPGDVIIEAEPRTVRRGGMRPEMEKVAFALKDGEVSEPFDIPQAFILFQVSTHSHLDLKDATPDIEKALRQQKIEATMAEIKNSSHVWMDDLYFAGPPKPPEAPTLGAPVLRPQSPTSGAPVVNPPPKP